MSKNYPPSTPLATSLKDIYSGSQTETSRAPRHRLSENSMSSTLESQPSPNLFPMFPSSLSYTTVRDFAYAPTHPMHYGPPPDSSELLSGLSTPVSENSDLSDSLSILDAKRSRGLGTWCEKKLKGEQLPPIHYGDGPPWSEDEDLHSPVVVSSRHRKHKLSTPALSGAKGQPRREPGEMISNILSQPDFEHNQGAAFASAADRSKGYHMSKANKIAGPSADTTIGASEGTQPHTTNFYNSPGKRDSHFAGTLPSRSYSDDVLHEHSGSETSSTASSPGYERKDESRYSRDYQFTIASSDEEMHGKAVALFDFVSENENELPLVEGQVIWVSYRHGLGWLVAEDPKTRESGLVPEEYVRLLRDIHGGLNGVTGNVNDPLSPIPPEIGTPLQADQGQSFGHFSNGNGYQQSIVSTFSTSSKDLHLYPQHLLGTQAGQAPPQVVHYPGKRHGSQVDMSVVLSPFRETQDEKNKPKRPRSEESLRNAFPADFVNKAGNLAP
ncbi:hypothetical protein K3495_g11340 [Podosphaera aphanis]|nr:hypothetical protein K3495_g11340 [Podosphaera aphanis]